MSNAKRMPRDERAVRYQRQNGTASLTPRQMKRLRHKARLKWIGPL